MGVIIPNCLPNNLYICCPTDTCYEGATYVFTPCHCQNDDEYHMQLPKRCAGTGQIQHFVGLTAFVECIIFQCIGYAKQTAFPHIKIWQCLLVSATEFVPVSKCLWLTEHPAY